MKKWTQDSAMEWLEERVKERSNAFDRRYSPAVREEFAKLHKEGKLLENGYHFERTVPTQDTDMPYVAPDTEPKDSIELTITVNDTVEQP